jgi:leucyl/phenylalanyl-tRNA---protein transferase
MAILIPSDLMWFPPIQNADEDGLVALTTDFSEQRLILGYKSGLFPWFQSAEYYYWFAPNPRCVLFPENLKISKSMQQVLKQNKLQFGFNTSFSQVIKACSEVPRKPVFMDGVLIPNDGTWINESYINQYMLLNQQGYCISAEAFHNGQLVGGLYGVLLGKVFFGESMFATYTNASKFAFIKLIEHLKNTVDLQLIDCQQSNPHLISLGANTIASAQFTNYLNTYIP